MTINCKATSGIKDWLIDSFAFPYKTGHGKVHGGFQKEIEYWWKDMKKDILEIIKTNGIDISKGFLISGRSKGAGEATLLIPYLSEIASVHICGAIEPPKVCDDKYAEYLSSFGTRIIETSYKNDIVTGIPCWFKHPGSLFQNGKRRLGLSVQDHIKSTTEEELWYDYINQFKGEKR